MSNERYDVEPHDDTQIEIPQTPQFHLMTSAQIIAYSIGQTIQNPVKLGMGSVLIGLAHQMITNPHQVEWWFRALTGNT